jgi:hypothetical protein
MATWAPPSDAVLAKGKPVKPITHGRAIRDLPAALAERASGSPWLNGIGAIQIFNNGFGSIRGDGERDLDGTWVVPDDVFKVEATLIGGGGAGGLGVTSGGPVWVPECGGGGGGGAIVVRVLDVTPGEVYTVIIGAGGQEDLINASVDTTKDSFVIGDGARTTFGVLIAAGGKKGVSGLLGGAGGAGGNLPTPELSVPTIVGADGGPALTVDLTAAFNNRSGSGAANIYGGGAPGRFDDGVGYDAFVATAFGGSGIPGTGGGGGHPVAGGADTKDGGRGAHGAVILRY